MLSRRIVSRRTALRLGLAGLAGTTALAKGCAQSGSDETITEEYLTGDEARAIPVEEREFSVTGDLPLKDRAEAKGLLYGAAAGYDALTSDDNLAVRYAQDCKVLVPENALKWSLLRPVPDIFDFSRGDWLVQFAQAYNMKVRGHTFVWNRSIPKWVKEQATPENAKDLLVTHIKEVMSHYAGQIESWDVVNEVIDIKGKNNLRSSLWLDMLGPDYIELAFRTAAAADPQAMLVLNDNWLEYDSRQAKRRRAAVLDLLRKLKDKGVRVDALGIQAHLWGGMRDDIDYDHLREFLADVASLGLKILITELDVRDYELPQDIELRDRMVAAAYEEYLSVVLEEPAVISVSTWGLSDRYTWISNVNPRDDGSPVRPLPLDADLNPKLAWNAIARAFDQAPAR